MATDALTLTFDPLTIEHLGSNMYSRLPNAVAELVANAYDADATKVYVQIQGSAGGQTITVSDNGHGMSWDDLAVKYLRIGRNRRTETSSERSENGRRKVSGKKGLGKLALFGIGAQVEVKTTREGSRKATLVVLDWDDLRNSTTHDYRPVTDVHACEATSHGTAVTVSRLARKTTISPRDLATSLARLFHYGHEDLQLTVVGSDGQRHPVTTELRLDNLDSEFSWIVPDDIEGDFVRILEEHEITGRVVAAQKPLRNQPRGIVVYAHGRLVNEPEFFGAADSSYAYAYLTGFVQIDMLDELRPDVIATDRRAVNWDHVQASPVHEAVRRTVEYIAGDRRRRRSEKKEREVEEVTGTDVDGWVDAVQGPAKEPLRRVLNAVTSGESDISTQERREILDGLNGIAPRFAELYWQDLHAWIKESCRRPYEAGLYHEAVSQAWIRYTKMVVAALGGEGDGDDKSVFGRAFGAARDDPNQNSALLSITARAIAHGEQLRKNTVASLEDGQRELSVGVASAFRNPLSHEEAAVLDRCGLLTYRQALDALGLISLLCARLEQAEPRESSSGRGEK